jgi:uncharacterized integral membrane protein
MDVTGCAVGKDLSMEPQSAPERTRLSGGAIASGTGIAALVVFMIQNTDDVKVKFLAWDFTLAVWLLVLVSALVGALVWFGLGVVRRRRRRVARRASRRG